jgi:histone-lysine N-methyltransferase SETD1
MSARRRSSLATFFPDRVAKQGVVDLVSEEADRPETRVNSHKSNLPAGTTARSQYESRDPPTAPFALRSRDRTSNHYRREFPRDTRDSDDRYNGRSYQVHDQRDRVYRQSERGYGYGRELNGDRRYNTVSRTGVDRSNGGTGGLRRDVTDRYTDRQGERTRKQQSTIRTNEIMADAAIKSSESGATNGTQSSPMSSNSNNSSMSTPISTALSPVDLLRPQQPASAVFSKRKEYMIAYDPELSRDKSKGNHPIYKFLTSDREPSVDPRDPAKYLKYTTKGRRTVFAALPVPRLVYDENSVGPPPATQILVSGLSSLTTKATVAKRFKAFGDLQSCEIIQDPDTGMSLGMCHIRFKGDVNKAHKIAYNALADASDIKIDMRGVLVEFDDNGEKAIKIMKEFMAKREKDAKEAAKEAAKVSARNVANEKLKESMNPKPARDKIVKDNTVREQTPTAPKVDRIAAAAAAKSIVKVPSKTSSSVRDIIDGRPYIMIKDRYVPTDDVYPSDIKRVLRDYDWVRVLCDDRGFYVIFDSAKEAQACFEDMDGRNVFEFRMVMDLYDGSSHHKNRDKPRPHEKLAAKKPVDVASEATNEIVKELHALLWKDVKERLVAPDIFEFLNPSRFEGLIKPKQEPIKLALPVDSEPATVVQDLKFDKLPSLPRFKKKKGDAKAKREARPMNHRLNYDSDEGEVDRKGTETPTDISELVVSKKRKSVVKPKVLQYSSSSEDEEQVSKKLKEEEIDEEDEEEEVQVTEKVEPEKPVIAKPVVAKPVIAKPVICVEPEDTEGLCWDQTVSESPATVCTDDLSSKMGLAQFQTLVRDSEDFEFLQLALKDTSIDDSVGNPVYWAWKNKEIKAVNDADTAGAIAVGDGSEDMLWAEWDTNVVTSRRSQGYFQIKEADKAEYLPHRRRLQKQRDTVARSERDTSMPGVPSSRLSRVNNRRLAADIIIQKQMLSSETDILNFNQLKKRKKPVKFARSAIHNWGLYAVEPIAANEMIIEYVGEVIRQQLSDLRERNYMRSGIGSSYLFRIDETTVVDATKKGGIARVSESQALQQAGRC